MVSHVCPVQWVSRCKGEIRRDTLSAGGGPCEDTRGKCPVETEDEEKLPQSRGHQGLQGEQEAEEVRKALSLTH